LVFVIWNLPAVGICLNFGFCNLEFARGWYLLEFCFLSFGIYSPWSLLEFCLLSFVIYSIMSGYSNTPLLKKLGIKEGMDICILNSPENFFDLLGALPDRITCREKLRPDLDYVHVFVKQKSALVKHFTNCRESIKSNGMIWISWPKKSSSLASDLDENSIRQIGLDIGLVDVKVCAVDETWSGLKFVIPLKNR
jgi:hypothetical protein